MTSAGDRASPCGVKMAGFIPMLLPKNCHSFSRSRIKWNSSLFKMVLSVSMSLSRWMVPNARVDSQCFQRLFILLANSNFANYPGVNALNSPMRSSSNTVAVKVNLACGRYVSTLWKYDWNSMFRVVRVFPIRLGHRCSRRSSAEQPSIARHC